LSDVKTFKAGDGLTWVDSGGRVFVQSLKELAAWRGNRGDAGRVRPDRFLTNNKFGQVSVNGNGKAREEK
jgi:topoisomerase-4 subunit A